MSTANQWRSMRSAPTDGTPFLCYGRRVEDDDEPTWAVCFLSTSRTLCMEATDSVDADEHIIPTHWMPLPEKPR
jgi:hypothetical protein